MYCTCDRVIYTVEDITWYIALEDMTRVAH